MKEHTLEEMKDLIRHTMDELYFLDTLGLTIDDLVEAFEDEISENYDKLMEVIRD